MKKARAWLTQRGLAHEFHDYRKQGVPADALDRWIAALGWEALVNRNGTTWRKLDAAERAAVVDGASARRLMLQHASVIRRPVVEWPAGATSVGFDPARWAER